MIQKSNRLKVLFVAPSLHGGGAERVMVTLLRHLDRAQFSLTLAVVDGRNAAYLSELPSDVTFVDLGCKRVRHAPVKVSRLIWDTRPDVVLSTLGHLNLVIAALMPTMPRSTAFVGREATIVSELLKDVQYALAWRLAYRILYRRFDGVVCQSQYMRNDLVGNHGIPEERAVVINNPVDVERIAATLAQAPSPMAAVDGSGGLRLVAAGRLSAEKGFDILIDAVALARDLNITLSILGEGPLLATLQSRVSALGLESMIRFEGFQTNPHRYFRDADALVLSSHYEGFPNVVLEAMACGIGVIATPAVGGTLEIVTGIEGCTMAESISAEALATAIRQWAAGPSRRVPPSALDRYKVPHIVAQYERLFKTVVAQHRGHARAEGNQGAPGAPGSWPQ